MPYRIGATFGRNLYMSTKNGGLVVSNPPEMGAYGFAICRFPKSEIIYETEIPNLEIETLEPKPKAKAKASGKAKAKASGKAKASKKWLFKPKKGKVGGQRVG